METKKLIYGKDIKYYSYYCKKDKCVVATDDYDEYKTHFERNKMGGDQGVHSIVKNTEEDGN
jgi:Tfp pilus assembly major pilin PilA